MEMDEGRGTIAFFATYRPPVPLDIYSSPYKPNSPSDETKLTDGKSYNYNGQVIPSSALKTILKSKKLATDATVDDVEVGRVTGLLFVSERTNNLETLHIGLQFQDKESSKVEVFNFADVYGTFKGTRMEDSGCIAGDYLVYVSTKDPSPPHQPWTAIYKTHLGTGNTDRLTPSGIGRHDLSPSTSPDGKRVAFASFQRKRGWDGEIEDLRTDIFIMNVVDKPINRKPIVVNGGWPTWATNDILFFHRNTNTPNDADTRWAVFRLDLRTNPPTETQVTPEEINAVTPAAVNETTVAVATMRKKYNINDPETEREVEEYRHIEIFSLSGEPVIRVTEMVRPKADHFNPFVIVDEERGMRIGYHRCNTDDPDVYSRIGKQFDKFQSPDTEKVDLVRVSGVFPSFSPDGSKLAFVDNEFKALWVADSSGLYVAYETSGANKIFSPVWNSNKDIDRIYVCLGPSFQANEKVEIAMIQNNSDGRQWAYQPLTGEYNNAFPSTNHDGTKIVYRSTRGHDEDEKKKYKNLFIMDAEYGDEEEVIQITKGKCVDTHCQWSPNDKWIAFASNRGNPTAQAPPGLPDPGFFGIYLTKADDPNFEPIKVVDSGFKRVRELFPGHCVHPCFSPDGRSLVFSADLAAVSVDPISLPLFVHSVRPYGDIFMVNLKMDDISKNKDMDYIRITHSRYENSTATWTESPTKDPYAKWNLLIHGHEKSRDYAPSCPYMHDSGAESIHMTGHLIFAGKRCC